jgi:hypothetical protein
MPDQNVMLCANTFANGDAQMPIFCARCGRTLYTSAVNLVKAVQLKAIMVCLDCVPVLKQEDELRFAGGIRKGAITPVDPKNPHHQVAQAIIGRSGG